jgi:hypothetical protein
MIADIQQPTQTDFAQWAEAVVLLAINEDERTGEALRQMLQKSEYHRMDFARINRVRLLSRCEMCLEYHFMNESAAPVAAKDLTEVVNGQNTDSWFFAGSFVYRAVIGGVIEKIDSISEKTK